MKKFGEYSSPGFIKHTFARLMDECGSNKSRVHHYENVYDYLISPPFVVNNFLEIGIFINDGPRTSLEAWSSLFPSANIYGADIQESRLSNDGKIQMYHVDQTNAESLEQLKLALSVELDVIVDDGAHKFEATTNTFEKLFPMLRAGGLYIIEDCHSDETYPLHTVSQLSEYFENGEYEYEIFESFGSMDPVSVDETTKEQIFEELKTPNHILCVYKK